MDHLGFHVIIHKAKNDSAPVLWTGFLERYEKRTVVASSGSEMPGYGPPGSMASPEAEGMKW